MAWVLGGLLPSQAELPLSWESKGYRRNPSGRRWAVSCSHCGPEQLSKPFWAYFSFGETGSWTGELHPSSKNCPKQMRDTILKVLFSELPGSKAQGSHQ